MLTLAAIIGAGAVYYGQLNEMRTANDVAQQALNKSAHDTIQASKDTQAALTQTRRTADAAVAQSKAALDANDITRQEQRSWLFPTIQQGIRPLENIGDLVLVTVSVQNTGKSLANDVRFRAWMNLFEATPDALLPEPPLRSAVIPPNSSRDIFFGTVPPAHWRRMNNLNDEKRPLLIVWADMTYTDRFKTEGQAYFCRMYDAIIKGFRTCPENRSWGPDRAK